LTAFHVAGVANELADFLSRRFDLSWGAVHADLLSRFPSQISWQIVQPPLDGLSLVTSSLSKQIWDAAYPLATPLPNPPPGSFGNGSVMSCDRIPIFAPAKTQSPYYNYLPGATAQAPWLPEVVKLQLKRWHAPFVPWGRHWPHWDNPTRGSLRRIPSIFGLPDNWLPTEKRTPLQNAANFQVRGSYS
jgi:hypothetical protein